MNKIFVLYYNDFLQGITRIISFILWKFAWGSGEKKINGENIYHFFKLQKC